MSEKMTLTPAEIFCDMQNSEHTKRAYRNDIQKWEQFLASRNGDESVETVLAFKDALIEHYAPSTAQRVWCTVAAFYGWMKGTERILATPFHGIKSPTRPSNEAPPVPSDTDIAKLLNATEDGTIFGSRSRLIVTLLLNGLRAQEVCDAKIENLKFDNVSEEWILDVLGKGKKWRAVPLTSETQQAIFDHFDNHKYIVDWLVPAFATNEPVTVKSIWRAVSVYARKAGVEGMHPHALRHHYATRLVRAGVDVFTLQKLMGHERADTTQRYVGLDYTDLSKAINLDPLHNRRQKHVNLFPDIITSKIEESAPF